jgi:hypothetical protein
VPSRSRPPTISAPSATNCTCSPPTA